MSEDAKICSKCKKLKWIDEFHKRKHRLDNHAGECKSCSIIRNKLWYKAHPGLYKKRTRDYQIRTYGLTPSQYQDLFNKQQERCLICHEKSSKQLAVDHDHKTGKVRGLLCNSCNLGLGFWKDNAERFLRASNYLEGIVEPCIA